MKDEKHLYDCLDETLESAEVVRESRHDVQEAGITSGPLSFFCPNLAFKIDDDDRDEVALLIEKWANERKLRLITVTPGGYELGERITSVFFYTVPNDGFIMATNPAFLKISDDVSEKLSDPRSVLFVRDLDLFTDLKYRRTLYDLINTHTICDEKKNSRFFDGLLFAVATFGSKARVGLRDDAKDAFAKVDLTGVKG